jgi:hypothetical protein
MRAPLRLAFLLCFLPLAVRAEVTPSRTPLEAAPSGAGALLAALPPPPRPTSSAPAPNSGDARVCAMIETAASSAGIDPHFFARLIWRESLFDPAAVSPKGARGIAQFIPSTAAMRALDDPFDAEKALDASALYLADLTRAYGNIGLAAVAYNGGEARAARYKAEGGTLPGETLAYVEAITGHGAGEWRLDNPKAALALKGATFQEGCLALAATRGKGQATPGEPLRAWGVIIATNRDRDGATRQVGRLRNRVSVLEGERVSYARPKRLGLARGMVVAQIGRDTRAEAEAFCARYRAQGGDCVVLRN